MIARPGSIAGPWKSGVVIDGAGVRWRAYPGGAIAAIVGARAWTVYTPSGRTIAGGVVRSDPSLDAPGDGPACERAADMRLRDRGLL